MTVVLTVLVFAVVVAVIISVSIVVWTDVVVVTSSFCFSSLAVSLCAIVGVLLLPTATEAEEIELLPEVECR